MAFGNQNSPGQVPVYVTSVLKDGCLTSVSFEDWSLIIRHAIRWMVYIVVFLGGAYAILLPIAMGYRSYWYVGIVMFCLFFLSFRGGRPKPATPSDGAPTPPIPPVAT